MSLEALLCALHVRASVASPAETEINTGVGHDKDQSKCVEREMKNSRLDNRNVVLKNHCPPFMAKQKSREDRKSISSTE